jgi:hypothetical protein
MPAKRPFDESYIPEPMSGCWLWEGVETRHGYGQIRHNGPKIMAHRASWLIHRGEIPPGLLVLHKCDTPACVNPDHLFLGTALDNGRDRVKKGRSAAHKRSGEKSHLAKLTADAVRAIRSDIRVQHVIARDYGISQTAVGLIKRRERWKHLA